MAVTLIVGSQWGDEGKGKIVDFLSQSAAYTVRFHGGNNAGHTVINKFGKFPLHLIPCGIFNKKAKACITNGVILDLGVLQQEINLLQKAGILLKNRLYISPRCHIIMPYHKLLDRAYEDAKGDKKTGTTGRGIGPTYADKVSYNGIRISDLQDKKIFSEKLAIQLSLKNKILQALGAPLLNQKDIEQEMYSFFTTIKPFVHEPYAILSSAIKKKQHILLEGAHGVFLDNDWGTYPFVTASTVLTGGVTPGAGIPAQKVTSVIGVVKAYTTRVGSGPFPTELFDIDGENLRTLGNEFGTTTGRPRRCGWFDAELIRFAAEINGYTGIAITKLDVLDTLKRIKVCTGYRYAGKKVTYTDGNEVFLSKVTPIYTSLPGWETSTKGITLYRDLPPKAKVYIKTLEKLVGVKVQYISTGANRNDIISR